EFGEKGYEKATLKSIAAYVGIKAPSIYAFFDNKDDLYIIAFQEVLDSHLKNVTNMDDKFEKKCAKDQLYSVLQKACDYHLHFESETKLLNRAMLFPPPSLEKQIHTSFFEEEGFLSQFLINIFKKGMEEGSIKEQEIDAMLKAYFCLLDGIYLQLLYYSPPEFKKRIDASWNYFWL